MELLSSSHTPIVFVKRLEERALKELWEMETRLAEYKRELLIELTVQCPAEGGMKVIAISLNMLVMTTNMKGRREGRGMI